MSAGDELAGDDLAGEDDPDAEDGTGRPRPTAILFDGVTRDFPKDENGRHVAIHPVDAEMQMACMVGLQGLGSSPTTGNELRRIEYLDPERLGAEVRDAMTRATKALRERGDVTIVDIRHETFGIGGLFVEVDYVNNRLPGNETQTARART
jgi:hypothetical protein